jgi:hypothetical protein
MPSKMYECEVRKLFKTKEGKTEPRWEVRAVSSLPSGSHPDVRCMHCHGAVRVHKSHVDNGPADHVEHLSRQDSESCIGGVYFDGTQRISTEPVE